MLAATPAVLSRSFNIPMICLSVNRECFIPCVSLIRRTLPKSGGSSGSQVTVHCQRLPINGAGMIRFEPLLKKTVVEEPFHEIALTVDPTAEAECLPCRQGLSHRAASRSVAFQPWVHPQLDLQCVPAESVCHLHRQERGSWWSGRHGSVPCKDWQNPF